jgi:hypothetical protein
MALSPVETELLGRVKRAAITLRCLPVDSRLKPLGLRSAWPEMKREMAVIYGDTRRAEGPRPAPEAIDDMDRLLDGLAALPAAPRRLLWARANGVRWAQLCAMTGRSRTSLNRDLKAALRRQARFDPEQGRRIKSA